MWFYLVLYDMNYYHYSIVTVANVYQREKEERDDGKDELWVLERAHEFSRFHNLILFGLLFQK